LAAFDVESYLEGKLERLKPSANGELTAVCPACEKWGKFYVNRTTGKFVCFSCEFRGRSIVGLVAHLEDIEWSEAAAYVFRHAVQLRRREPLVSLADRIRLIRGGELADDVPTAVDYDLPDKLIPCFNPRTEKWSLPPYLKERKIKSSTARAWGMAYCRSIEIDIAGREKPLFLRRRLFIPIVCPNGHSWTARDMTGAQLPKYMNPPNADHRRLLIGWNMCKLTGDLVLCEGPLDAVKLWQHDIAALALGGKVLHDEQLALLLALSPETAVTVMLDPEELEAPLAVAERLSVYFKNIYLAKLPMGEDPGSSTREMAHSALERSKRWKGARGARLSVLLDRSRSTISTR
jgi:DNA primase